MWFNSKQAWGFPKVKGLMILLRLWSSTLASIWVMTEVGNSVISPSPAIVKRRRMFLGGNGQNLPRTIPCILLSKLKTWEQSDLEPPYWTILFLEMYAFLFLYAFFLLFPRAPFSLAYSYLFYKIQLKHLSHWHTPIYSLRFSLSIISTEKPSWTL